MTNQLTPEHLSRYQTALSDNAKAGERFAQAQQTLAKAQQDVQAARDACLATDSVLRALAGYIRADYGIDVADNVNPETGVITRAPRPEPVPREG